MRARRKGRKHLQLTILNFLRDAEVGDLNAALVVHQHICTLDITVDDVAFVQIVQAKQNLPDPVTHERLFERTIVPKEGSNGSTRDVLQEDVEVIIVNAGGWSNGAISGWLY